MLIRFSHSLLPELYDIFGEKLIELIVIFGGKNIKIPSMEEINMMSRDARIYNTLSQGDFLTKLDFLKKTLNFPTAVILERYDMVRKDIGMPVRSCVFCKNSARKKALTCSIKSCSERLYARG